MNFPYTYISCPCTDVLTASDTTPLVQDGENEEEEQEREFDPKSPRVNFSLYPLDNLMWCDDCQEIRCPRCTVEEVVCWFCPSCLFEVPTSMVKSEANRCARNCFNCPICTAPMTVNTLNAESGASTRGPWILACGYCNWTSLDIGIQFDKPTNVSSQLAKLTNGGGWKPLAPLDAEPSSDATPENTNVDSKFSSLKSFLGSQLSASNPLNPLMSPSSERNYSPSNLARIMNLYTGTGPSVKKASSNTSTMRESADTSEGLHVVDRVFESNNVQRLRQQGWSGTTSMAQRAELRQPPRFVDDLIPIPTLLRTKRSKRCRACYHILVKQETKVMSTKYRIKLLASNHIPEISLKPLHPVELDASSDGMIDLDEIIPHKPWQFLLTLKNPMDEPVVVTLATPNFTPGKYKHKVTLLCPQFEIGRNKEVWDEALGSSDIRGHANRPNRESKQNAEYPVSQYEGRFPVAGKVWEKGRNWTTVVLEVVCVEVEGKDEEREEDEDVVEVPVSVRIEYEVEVDVVKEKASKEKEKRDLAYWCVLGVGRIQDVARMSEEKS